MVFDENSWCFPKENLIGKSLYLSLRKVGLIFKKQRVTGGRLECMPIELPNINYGYKETEEVEPDILLDFTLPTDNLNDLSGKRFSRHELQIDDSAESVYLFGAHNPVELLDLNFGSINEKKIETNLTVRFHMDIEDKIGGVFENSFNVQAEIEVRLSTEQRH